MRPRVKICGIMTSGDALFCAEAGADALGFIFYDRSPRYILPSSAARIIRTLPPFVTPVGVFVNSSRSAIEAVIGETGIRTIQLSGDEEPEDCRGFAVGVVKVFRIVNPGDVGRVKQYEIAAAMLDGSKGGAYGGTGTLPDLSIAVQMKHYHHLIVAGGLNSENVLDVVRTVQPYAIDLNSGLEHSPGEKDRTRVRALFDRLAELQ